MRPIPPKDATFLGMKVIILTSYWHTVVVSLPQPYTQSGSMSGHFTKSTRYASAGT